MQATLLLHALPATAKTSDAAALSTTSAALFMEPRDVKESSGVLEPAASTTAVGESALSPCSATPGKALLHCDLCVFLYVL